MYDQVPRLKRQSHIVRFSCILVFELYFSHKTRKSAYLETRTYLVDSVQPTGDHVHRDQLGAHPPRVRVPLGQRRVVRDARGFIAARDPVSRPGVSRVPVRVRRGNRRE